MSDMEQLSYEQALARLDETLRTLEDGKISLEDAIAAVARGREYLQLAGRLSCLPEHAAGGWRW